MKTYFAVAILSMCCLVTSCNKTGTPTEFGKACDPANDKKVLEVTGYIDDGGSLFCSNIGGGPVTCGFKLKQNASDKDGIKIDIETGSSANTVEKPSGSYKREDLKIRDNSGNVINLADKFRITGTMHYAPGSGNSPGVCYVTVTKIEK
jgi:hypothetical protein